MGSGDGGMGSGSSSGPCVSWNVVWNDGLGSDPGRAVDPDRRYRGDGLYLRHNVREGKSVVLSTRDPPGHPGSSEDSRDSVDPGLTISPPLPVKIPQKPNRNRSENLDNTHTYTHTGTQPPDYTFIISSSWFVIVLLIYLLYRIRIQTYIFSSSNSSSSSNSNNSRSSNV